MYTTMGQSAPPMGASNPSGGIRLSFINPADQAKFEDLFTRAAASSGGNNLPAMAARDILTRSRLDNDSLAKIWDLCSIANAPYLTFPEFAVAMYLTSEKLRGKLIPNTLPPAIREETELAMATLASKQSSTPSTPQHQLQPLQQQHTSFMQPQQPMMTGMPPPQQQPMMTGMPPQHHQQQQQFSNPSFQNLMHPSNLSVPLQTPLRTGIAPPMHNNTPRLGNQDFASKMMPNQSGGLPNFLGGRSSASGFSWKISPEEKQRYREIFRAWIAPGEDYMSGEAARDALMQSQLPEQDLMRIWGLVDKDNNGSLDEDEFAIAMHLIYRRLNGFDIPSVLPTELAPPSSVLKKFVLGRQINRPAPSFSRDPSQGQQQQRSPATSPQQDRDSGHGGYVSSARRKGPASRFMSSAAARPRMQSYDEEDEDNYREEEDPALEELRHQIAETKVALDRATRSKSSRQQDYSSSRYSTEELKEKIRKTQEELTRASRSNPKYFENQEILLDLLESQKTLQDEIQYLCNRDIPVLARQLRGATAELRDTKVRYARKNDGSQDFMAYVEPTGPGGIVTESDRVRAKAKAMMAARKAGTSSTKDTQFELRKAEQEKEDYDRQADTYERDMERARDSLRDLRGDLRYLNSLAESKTVVEKKRFDKGHELPYELRRFVEQLERDSALDIATSPRFTPSAPSYGSAGGSSSSSYAKPAASSPAATSTSSRSISSPKPAAPAKPRTAEEIKKEAERRVQERLAALQAKRSPSRSPRPSPASTPSQPNEDELAAQRRLRDAEQQAQAKIREGESRRDETERQPRDYEREAREAEMQREQAEREQEERRIQEERDYEQRRIEEEKELEARRQAVLQKEEQDRLARHAAIQKAEEEREEQRRREQEAEKKAMEPPAAPSAPSASIPTPPPPPPPPAATQESSIPPPPPAPLAPEAPATDAAANKMSSNNPFAKLQGQQQQDKQPEETKKEEAASSVAAADEPEKQPNSKRISYNPFAAFSAFSATKANDDESDSDDDDGWDVVHHDDTDDENEFPAAGSAKNLAGMLFNAMSQRKSPMMQPREIPSPAAAPAAAPVATPPAPVAPAASTADVPPPPPPPAVGGAAPAAPPPPPPASPPAPPAPPASSDLPEPSSGRSALLSQIQMGTKLRKAVTNDRSAASVTGKVIDGGDSASLAPSQPPVAQQPSSPTPPPAATPSSNFLAELQERTGGGSPSPAAAAPAPVPVAAPALEPIQQQPQEGKEYIAQWAYTGQGDGDLSFEQDATIIVLNDSDPDWWYGSVKGSTDTGYFPKSYVQEPGAAAVADTTAAAEPVDKVRLPAKALYDFEGPAGEEDCLSFEAGASLVILDKDSNDWWRAELPSTGKKGLVPANYVQLD